MINKNKQLLDEIEVMIRAGKGHAARQILLERRLVKVSRNDNIRLANLARRLDLAGLAARVLNPLVRPTNRATSATDEEKSEYAAALTKLGALQEAGELLSSVDTTRTAEALLFRAFTKIAAWDYESSLDDLQSYCDHSKISDYSRLLGKLNLAGVLVHLGNRPELEKLLSDLSRDTVGYPLLYGNLLLFRAEFELSRKNFGATREALNEASAITNEMGGLYGLFVEKWQAFLVLRDGKTKKDLAPLYAVREEAVRQHHWNTVRECDFFEAVETRRTDLLVHLYFGTPFPHYRKRIPLAESDLPAIYPWMIREGKTPKGVDFFSPKSPFRDLKVGQLSQRLLAVLVSDFYRPFRIASLHAELYPNEYFNPISSPSRVHRVIHRLRSWLKSKRLPLTVAESDHGYRLTASQPLRIDIPASLFSGSPNKIEHLLVPLAREGRFQFRLRDILQRTDLSESSVLVLVNTALSEGVIRRTGRGKSTFYEIDSHFLARKKVA